MRFTWRVIKICWKEEVLVRTMTNEFITTEHSSNFYLLNFQEIITTISFRNFTIFTIFTFPSSCFALSNEQYRNVKSVKIVRNKIWKEKSGMKKITTWVEDMIMKVGHSHSNANIQIHLQNPGFNRCYQQNFEKNNFENLFGKFGSCGSSKFLIPNP